MQARKTTRFSTCKKQDFLHYLYWVKSFTKNFKNLSSLFVLPTAAGAFSLSYRTTGRHTCLSSFVIKLVKGLVYMLFYCLFSPNSPSRLFLLPFHFGEM